MDNLRQRIPFKIVEDDDIQNDNNILDEQEQEALVENLRRENEIMNSNHYFSLKILVGLSVVLRLVAMSHNPLLAFYPVTSGDPSIPLPSVFSLLSLFIHLNFALILWSDTVRIYFRLESSLTSLSFPVLYCLSAVAPTFSFFLNKPWQTIIWWSITPFMVFIVQTILASIQSGSDGIICLESLKYAAPGA